MSERTDVFREWAILELMGHRRLAGLVSIEQLAGAPFLRLDIPGPDGTIASQFYSASAVYCLTPTTEAIARAVALREQPAPVQPWELPPAVSRAERMLYPDDGDSSSYPGDEDED